jgi:hypothetical protein
MFAFLCLFPSVTDSLINYKIPAGKPPRTPNKNKKKNNHHHETNVSTPFIVASCNRYVDDVHFFELYMQLASDKDIFVFFAVVGTTWILQFIPNSIQFPKYAFYVSDEFIVFIFASHPFSSS